MRWWTKLLVKLGFVGKDLCLRCGSRYNSYSERPVGVQQFCDECLMECEWRRNWDELAKLIGEVEVQPQQEPTLIAQAIRGCKGVPKDAFAEPGEV